MNILNTLITSWKENIIVFKSINSLLLVSLKSLFNKFQIFLFFISLIAASCFDLYKDYFSIEFLSFIATIFLFLFLSSLRSSVEKKKFSYYIKLFLSIRSFSILFWFFYFFELFAKDVRWVILLPLLILMYLFIADSQPREIFIKSYDRGFLMYIYNLPFCLIITGIYILSFFLLLPLVMVSQGIMLGNFLKLFFGTLVFPGIWIFCLMLYIALIVSFYLKRVHDQYSLYYKKNNI